MPQKQSTLLQNVTLIDGSGSEPQPGVDVLVTGDRISALGRSGSLSVDHQNVEIYSLHDMTLLQDIVVGLASYWQASYSR